MRRILCPSICIVVLCAQACTPGGDTSSAEEGRALRVSMVQLLASPERFDGKRIQVQGVFQLGNEERALYLSRDDAAYLNFSNGLWLNTIKGVDTNSTYVTVEGTFNVNGHGHLGLWPGEIREVSRIERVRSREEYPRGMVN
jgi:hypothetical protein